jgi:hypothetical protein
MQYAELRWSEQRHRLNTVIFRRTKANACRPDGSTLFARRQVQYRGVHDIRLRKDILRGVGALPSGWFRLGETAGQTRPGLAFVMTTFQKIAASSFSAVQRTLRRRLIVFTIQDALIHNQNLDIDRRNTALDEARIMIRELHGIAEGRFENAEVDKVLADYRYKILRSRRKQEAMLGAGAHDSASEASAADAQNAVISSVLVALPGEGRRIHSCLTTPPWRRKLLERGIARWDV